MYATNTLVDRADYRLTAGIFVKILNAHIRQQCPITYSGVTYIRNAVFFRLLSDFNIENVTFYIFK